MTTQITEDSFRPLDIEELQYLNDGLKERYMQLERLYENDAWHLVKAWASKNADQQVIMVMNAQNWEQTVYARGLRDGYLAILNMERANAFEFRNLVEASKQAKQEAEEAEAESDNE
jgi:hypothetical protein